LKEIIPGIYQIQVPIPNNPLEYTNTYLIRENNECLLIDAGSDNEKALDSFAKQLAETGTKFKDIKQIIVTHLHRDHYGLAGKLQQLSQAKIALHHRGKELIILQNTDMRKLLNHIRQWQLVNGVPAREFPEFNEETLRNIDFVPLASPDIILHGGETISAGVFNFQVLWTPGHSPGHICLYEPEQKILFSGDHILPIITPNVSLQPQHGDNPLGDFLSSLDRVKQLEVKLILPAHEHIFTDLPTRIEELFQHHRQRKADILATIKAKAKTAYQISLEIIWMPELGGVRGQDLAPLDRRMAVLETLAHLESMRADGEVDKFSQNGIIYYQCI
jgi:glyoxylase-like metal-dependent hydrolase (beta-lactamase superfamily II)